MEKDIKAFGKEFKYVDIKDIQFSPSKYIAESTEELSQLESF